MTLTELRYIVALKQTAHFGKAAEKCFVEQDQYLQWLQHYKEPTCRVDVDDGSRCAATLERVDIPNQFVAAYSDRCLNHREYVESPVLRKSQ